MLAKCTKFAYIRGMKKVLPCLALLVWAFGCGQDASQQSKPPTSTVASKGFEKPRQQRDDTIEQDELLQATAAPQRDQWQKPERVLHALQPRPNEIIADINAGTGYFCFKLAEEFESQVLALERNADYLHRLEDQKRTRYARQISQRIESRLCTDSTLALDSAEANAFLMVNGMANYPQPQRMFSRLYQLAGKDTRFILVDFKAGDMPYGPVSGLKVPLDSVLGMLEQTKWNIHQVDTTSLPYQYMVVMKTQSAEE